MLREAEVDARRLLDAVDAAISVDEALLRPKEQFQILRAMQDVADLLEECAENEGGTRELQKDMRENLRRATEGLNAATTAFAGRRMDARVRSALSGRTLDQIAV